MKTLNTLVTFFQYNYLNVKSIYYFQIIKLNPTTMKNLSLKDKDKTEEVVPLPEEIQKKILGGNSGGPRPPWKDKILRPKAQ